MKYHIHFHGSIPKPFVQSYSFIMPIDQSVVTTAVIYISEITYAKYSFRCQRGAKNPNRSLASHRFAFLCGLKQKKAKRLSTFQVLVCSCGHLEHQPICSLLEKYHSNLTVKGKVCYFTHKALFSDCF